MVLCISRCIVWSLIPTFAKFPDISSYSCLVYFVRVITRAFFYSSSLRYGITIVAADHFLETSMTFVDF